MNTYYYVYRQNTGQPPTVRHATFDEAKAEAERLAEKHVGAVFEVLKAVAISKVSGPAHTVTLSDAPLVSDIDIFPTC